MVVTGTISITVEDPLRAADKVTRIVTDAGGRIDGRVEQSANAGAPAAATLALRVPTDQVDPVRTALADIGHVEATTLKSSDQSAATRDLDARISTLKASIGRFTQWLSSASQTADLIELEKEIGDRQSQLETLEAQQRDLADQVALATITLELREHYVAPRSAPTNFLDGLAMGWAGFTGFWSFALIALGALLPWLVLGALIAAGVLVLVRLRRARTAGRTPREEPPASSEGEHALAWVSGPESTPSIPPQ